MKKQDWLPLRISTLFPVELVRIVNLENAGFKRFDRWVEVLVCHGCSPLFDVLESLRINGDYTALAVQNALGRF
jgi:hypothetical protein